MPVLLIAGALDTKFVDIAQQMHARIPTSTLSVIADAGHSVHLEKPEAVAREIDNWLSQAQKDTDRKHNAKK
jgi:pimeloyl-ACP methyl ester carboxylesterase